MPTQLTNQEKVICANSRISESEYLAQKAKNVAGPMTVQINPGLRDATRAGHHATMSALPAPEREIAAAMNLDPRDYLARKVAGRAGTAVMRHSVLGVDGRAAINGARLEHRDLMEDESINVAD